MANNKQHVVATTNEILDTKSGKTLDRIVNKGGGEDGQKDVIVTIVITQEGTSGNYNATVRYSSCNYSVAELSELLQDKNARDSVDYYVRIIFDNPTEVITQDSKVFGTTPIKLPISSIKNPNSSGITFYFYGPCIDTASGYLQNKQYTVTIPLDD